MKKAVAATACNFYVILPLEISVTHNCLLTISVIHLLTIEVVDSLAIVVDALAKRSTQLRTLDGKANTVNARQTRDMTQPQTLDAMHCKCEAMATLAVA